VLGGDGLNPMVSIITPAYNCKSVLPDAISSVAGQTYCNWEHIIIDDASEDETRAVIEKFSEEDERIRPVYIDRNGGVANARNRGILEARGKYIAFLDSDDFWRANKLEKQIEYMEKTGAGFVFSDYYVVNSSGKFLFSEICGKQRLDYKDLLRLNRIGCLTVVVRSEIMKMVGMPDTGHEDYACWLKILGGHIDYAYKVGGVLGTYRIMKGSVSANKFQSFIWNWRIYREHQKFGVLVSSWRLAVFIYFASLKYIKRSTKGRSNKLNE